MTARQDLAEQPGTAVQPEPDTHPESDPQPEPDAQHETDAQHEEDVQTEASVQTGTDARTETGSRSETGGQSGTKAEPEAADAEPQAAEPQAAAEPEGGGSRGVRFTRSKVVGALAAMLAAALAATAVLQWVSATRAEDARAALESERALRLEVSGAAGAFSKALLSYDYRDLQTTRSTLAAQATGDFLNTYDEAFGGAMAQVIVKLKATAQATVREVYLADADEATAHAIVVVDQQVTTSEAIRSVKDSHLKISLVREKGSWKIHDVTALGAASEDQYNLDGDKDDKD